MHDLTLDESVDLTAAEARDIALTFWMALIMPIIRKDAEDGRYTSNVIRPWTSTMLITRRTLPKHVQEHLEFLGFTASTDVCSDMIKISW